MAKREREKDLCPRCGRVKLKASEICQACHIRQEKKTFKIYPSDKNFLPGRGKW